MLGKVSHNHGGSLCVCVQASTSLFEAACSDRIQQFDDEEESEEEEEGEDDVMWPDKDANLASPMDHHR